MSVFPCAASGRALSFNRIEVLTIHPDATLSDGVGMAAGMFGRKYDYERSFEPIA